MKKLRGTRRAFSSTLGAAALLGLASLAVAQDFPARGKPIRIVVGFTAGGGTDGQARIVAQKLGEVLGTSVIVDNKPGASTMLAANEVSRALPDGYTLLYAPSSTMAQNPHTFNQVPYDPFKDFTAISMGGRGPLVLSLSTSVPVNSVKELVAYVKAHPGKVSYASFGAGTSSHIYGEAFVKKTGIDAVHIPYKGGSAAVTDLLGGRLDFMAINPLEVAGHVGSGALRALAVLNHNGSRLLPGVPTARSLGVNVQATVWWGLVAPAGTPPAVVQALNQALNKSLAQPAVQQKLADIGASPMGGTPAEFGAFIQAESAELGEVIRAANIRAD